jgi:membrane fusion protein (multidrug efflux system)
MKQLFFLRFCVIGGLALFGAACNPQKKPPPPLPTVTVFQVETQTIPANFEFVGVAKSSHPVEIRSRVEGYLWSIDYVEGSMVNEGDPLFLIDPRQFEASVDEAKGVLARQEAALWTFRQSLDRIGPLYAQNAASRKDLDNATGQVLAAEASVITAKANLVQADLNLSYTKILSPIKGLSARAAFREGTLITPSVNGLLTIISVIDPIWINFSISDNELLQGRSEKTKSQLILPAQEDYSVSLILSDGSVFPHLGEVSFTSPTLDPKTGSMVVRAVFPNPEGTIRPGQFVRATVMGAKRPNAFFVPQQAVFQGQKGKFVYVVGSNNTVSARLVSVGAWYNDYWVITEGLKEGEIVVSDGVNKVKEGSEVKILSVTKPKPQDTAQ